MTTFMEKLKPYQKLSAGTLKMIAIITMLIDHFAAGVYANLYMSGYLLRLGQMEYALDIYNVCRGIGRFAFPIFCFLLVEGFFYTKSRLKYLRNLVIFAVVSEVPFDLLLMGGLSFDAQNVFFTLAIALCTIWGLEVAKEKASANATIGFLLQALFVIAGSYVAHLLHTDYKYYGVVLVVIFYYYRNNRVWACILGYLWFLFEPWCFPAFIALLFYSGKRGIRLKYFFYAFYPMHLLLLYGLRVLLLGT